jgi:sugar transferase (PEP-CTERM/EpsH1 system associated)
MRILQIAPRLCWPLDTGAKLRNFHLARVLAEQASVSLLTFADREASTSTLRNIYERIVTVVRNDGYTFSKIARGAVGRTPLPVLNYTSREMTSALTSLLDENQFDIVQIESVHLINYLPPLRAVRSQPLIVCDWHNIESELMQQYAQREQNIFRRAYARRTARLLRVYENRALQEFDAHICVSERDCEQLSQLNPGAKVQVIENGVDTNYYSYSAGNLSRHRILFVGSMDYHANIDGAVHFARDVWPQVHARHPQLVFTIVGKDPGPEVRKLETIEGIEVTGTVDDVRPFYGEAVASVVPLRVGGGSRLKILEAMAAGVPVISTRLGGEGLEVQNGENVLIADNISELVTAIVNVLENDSQRQHLINAGRALVTEHYDWSKLGHALFNFYKDLKREASPAYADPPSNESDAPAKQFG